MDGMGKAVVSLLFALLVASSLITMPVLASDWSPAQADGQVAGAEPGSPLSFQPGGPGNGGPPGHDRGSDANVSIPEMNANTTVELLRNSRSAIAAVDANGKKATSAQEDAIQAINRSIDEYRKLTFANTEAALEYQRDAQKALDRLEKRVRGSAAADVENASATLYTASNLTSRLATREAYELVQQYEDAFDTPGQRQAAESALGTAADAIARADAKSPAKGTGQYRTAWRNADRAVTIVERNVEPTLTVQQGPAFERNETVEVLVSVEITDARPYAYEEATVTIDGREAETIDLWTEPVAGGSATGHYYVDVGEELTNRSVTVSATANHDPSRAVEETLDLAVTEANVIRQPPAPDEVTEVEVDDESGATVTTRGPGLQASDVTVRSETPETNPDAYASPVIDVQNASAFHNATLTIPVDESAVGDGNLSIVHFGTGADKNGWRPLETEIDTTNATATATVTSFSRFAVMNDREIIESITDYADPGWPVLDDFSSMNGWETDGTVSHGEQLAVLESEPRDDPDDPKPAGPTARIAGPSTLDIGTSGTWSAADSTGDGLRYDWSGSVSGSGVTVSDTFYYGGTTERITLTVTDGQGRSDTTTKNVQITCPGGYCPEPDTANKSTLTAFGVAEETAGARQSADGSHTSTMSRTLSIDENAASAELSARILAEMPQSGGFATVKVTGESGDTTVLFEAGERDDGSPGDPDGPAARISGPSSLDIATSGTWSGADSTGVGLSYDWSGSVSGSGVTVSETFYHGETTEQITLTVTDDEGRSDTTTKTVQITCPGGYCPEYVAADERNQSRTGSGDIAAIPGDESWEEVSADISQYAGEEVTVTVEAADGATVATDYVGVLTDSTGSGLPDAAEELDLHMPPVGEGRYLFSPLNLDPTVADTDYDGLGDGEEVDVSTDYVETASGWQLRGVVTDASSHPFRAGTDGDGLTDYEEAERWGTVPLLADTSGDGFNDMVDPEPLGRTTTPEATYKTEHWAKIIQNELVVEARPTGAADEIADIEVEKYVDPWDPVRDAEWQTATQTGTEQDGEFTVTSFKLRDERDFSTVKPDEVKITVVDEDGNKLKIHHNRESGESYVTAGVAAGATAATHTWKGVAIPGGEVAVAGIIILAAGVGVGHALVTAERIDGHEDARELGHPVPPTPAEGTWETPESIEITLPSGTVYESVGDHHRGFGWEHIQKTTDLRLSAVWNTIQDPEEVIREDDEVRYIIGESLSEDEKIILEIIGGTVISAAAHETVIDPLGREVYIDKDEQHAIRDGKDITYEELKDAIENPDEIWKGSTVDFYVKKMPDGTYRIIKVYNAGGVILIVSTVIVQDSVQGVEEYLTEDIQDLLRRIY